MKYWLVKTEPDVYSWDMFVKDKRTFWDGVRNYQARNNMQAMKNGDQVIFYHTGEERQAVGIAEVVKEAYQDPTTDETAWVCVDLKPVRKLATPITLAQIKADPKLKDIGLIKNGRLSVVELTAAQFSRLVS